MKALYEGKSNLFDMAKQDTKIGSIVRYQNNIRTILNQGAPQSDEKMKEMKEALGKEYAGIIATKSVWKKPSQAIGDVYKEKGFKEYAKQNEILKEDRKKHDYIQNYLEKKDGGFKSMMSGMKGNWKNFVDTSMKALTPNASEMLRDYMKNKKLVTENEKNKNTGALKFEKNEKKKRHLIERSERRCILPFSVFTSELLFTQQLTICTKYGRIMLTIFAKAM